MLGEMGAGGAVLDHVYETLIEPKHRELCALWAAATGQEAESEAVRLAVFAFIGQIVYFRIARPLVDRRMNWDGSTPAAASRIADRIVANLHLTLSEGAEP